MAVKMPIGLFVSGIEAAYKRGDGYIMGAVGQDPKKMSDWYFTGQYSGSQRTKAKYWREHAARVWDCNGLAEGLYKDYSGTSINTQAKYNYSQWCDPKGSGMIPTKKRVAGAAVFWGDSPSKIHHVAYLYKPVDAAKPTGDWYLIEARGVMYGVVRTRLLSRKPNYWGLMTKYFDYSAVAVNVESTTLHLGDRLLKNGSEGQDVAELQVNLIELGYSCGSWGADGDFGDATEIAVRAFQKDHGIRVDGEFGPKSYAAMVAAIAALKGVDTPRSVVIVGGNCYARSAPNTGGSILGVAYGNERFDYGGQTTADGWNLISFKNQNAWVSGKYSRLDKG